MSADMESTKYQNVFQRTSNKRRNPRDGKWDICYYIIYRINGKKKWEKIGWRSEGITGQIAYQVRADRLQAMRQAELPPDLTVISPDSNEEEFKDLTMDRAWSIYNEKCLIHLARPQDEQGRYKYHIAPRFGSTRLDRITSLDLETFKNDLLGSGLAPATVKHILGNIRRVYNKMVEWELYDGRVPTAKLKMPKIDNARMRFLTPVEADQLLAAIKSKSLAWWRISVISLKTGMRLGEVLSLAKNDVDLENGVIQVLAGKTGARIAHMSDTLKKVFKDVFAENSGPVLFPTRDGQHRKLVEASKSFPRAVDEVGLNRGVNDRRQKVVFHTLRHTFASWLAIRGVPLYTISTLMGHSTVEMTKRYAHLCPDTQREAVQEIDNMANHLI